MLAYRTVSPRGYLFNFSVSSYSNRKSLMAPTDRDRSKRVVDADVSHPKKVNHRWARKRLYGIYGAEIRDPTIKRHTWLGTYDTPRKWLEHMIMLPEF